MWVNTFQHSHGRNKHFCITDTWSQRSYHTDIEGEGKKITKHLQANFRQPHNPRVRERMYFNPDFYSASIKSSKFMTDELCRGKGQWFAHEILFDPFHKRSKVHVYFYCTIEWTSERSWGHLHFLPPSLIISLTLQCIPVRAPRTRKATDSTSVAFLKMSKGIYWEQPPCGSCSVFWGNDG